MKNFLLSLALLLSANMCAQTVDGILEKHLAYTGGEKNWKKITSIVTSGEYDYGGTKFPFTSYSKSPDKYKFVVPFNGKYYAQAFDGVKGWKIDAFKNETAPTILNGNDAKAMANESDVALEPAFINYKTKGHNAILEKDTTIKNMACHKIRFTRKGGEKEFYYFDTKTFAVVMKKAASKNTEMGGSVMTTYYSDYRDIGGIKIPFIAASDINGQPILTITIEKATVNVAVDDKEFQP